MKKMSNMNISHCQGKWCCMIKSGVRVCVLSGLLERERERERELRRGREKENKWVHVIINGFI